MLTDKVVASQQERSNVDPGILTTFVLDTEEWLANFVGMDSLQLLAECLQSGASFVSGKARKDMFLQQIQQSLLKHWRLVVDNIKVSKTDHGVAIRVTHEIRMQSDRINFLCIGTYDWCTIENFTSPDRFTGGIQALSGFLRSLGRQNICTLLKGAVPGA